MEKRTPNNTKIKIYTTSWCGPCKMAKKLLTEKGFNFEEIDIEEHNAKTLKRLEHATVCSEFTKEEIEMWIRNGKQKKELYNESIDLMVEMIENPKKDFRSRISKLWI